MSSTPSAAEICEIADECGITVREALEAARDVLHAKNAAMEDIAADMAAEYAATEYTSF